MPPGDLQGTFEIGASTGPGGVVLSGLLCDFAAGHPGLQVALSVFDTQTIVDRVADRTLELGVVGAAPKHRGVDYEPFFRDTVTLACPPGHAFAGRTITLDELRGETLLVMQDGAGVRRLIEDELASAPASASATWASGSSSACRSRWRAPCAGHGVTFISRLSIENDLAAGTLTEATVEGLQLEREVLLVRADRAVGDACSACVPRVRAEPAAVIVRSCSDELPEVLAEAGIERPFVIASERWRALDLPHVAWWTEVPSRAGRDPWGGRTACSPSAADRRSTPARRRRPRAGLPLVSVPTTYSGAEWTTFFGVRSPDRVMRGGGAGAHPAGIVYDVELTLDLPREVTRRHRAQRARAHGRGAVRARPEPRGRREALAGAPLIARALPRVLADGAIAKRASSCSPARCTPVTRSGIAGLGTRACDGAGRRRRATGCRTVR